MRSSFRYCLMPERMFKIDLLSQKQSLSPCQCPPQPCAQPKDLNIQFLLMGNQVCCDDLRQDNPIEQIQAQDIKLSETHKHVENPLPPPSSSPPPPSEITVPSLSPIVSKTILQHNFSQFFEKQVEDEVCVRKYGEDVYKGLVDKETLRPDGFGRMYKSDGSLYVGSFKKGKAHGLGAFIFANGSFFQGAFEDNQACCEHGLYQADGFKYNGSFKNNCFWGKGREEGPKHSFEGEYAEGKRVNGTLKWRDEGDFEFFYTGPFNEKEQFHGKGVLAETKGVYEGDFVNGVKEGTGYYRGVNGVKYRGDYKAGVKEGFGAIFNSDDSIAYKGEFKNGLPHGKGAAYSKDRITEAQWVEGIDQMMLSAVSSDSPTK